MFQKNWKGIFNISKNTQNQPKNGHAGKVRIQRFCRKLRSPQNMLFFLQSDCFHERTRFWMFQKNWKGIFIISKNTQNQQKNGHAGKVRLQGFCQKLKSPQNMLFFLQSDCFHERTKFWMFLENWKGIFNISKNTQNQPKNGHAGKVRIQQFCRKLRSPQNMLFFLQTDCFRKEQNFESFARMRRVFSAFQKILKINQKMATPVRSEYSDFAEYWKVPKTCFFFLQSDCFHERTKFWRFLENWKGIFNISKNTQNQPKNATPVRSGYSNFAENWEVPKKCFSLFKAIVFIKEQNFECFRRIGRVFSTFQKILKINQKMPRR